MSSHSLTSVSCKKISKAVLSVIKRGSCNMYDDSFDSKSKGRQALAMSIMAYCLSMQYDPKVWTEHLIDCLVKEGDRWHNNLAEEFENHPSICEVIPFGSTKLMHLNKEQMKVFLDEPEIIGYSMTLDPMVRNLYRGFKAFFSVPEPRGCILLSRMVKLVIWKNKSCYFVFDPAGRDKCCYQDFRGGAALITVGDLDDVIQMLLTRTGLGNQRYLLAPVKILNCDQISNPDNSLQRYEISLHPSNSCYQIENT